MGSHRRITVSDLSSQAGRIDTRSSGSHHQPSHDGHVVVTAESGEAGLARAAQQDVDLILLDVLMPGLSGYEVLSTLKADATLREIPVLMISALDQTASVTRCIALGADDYLTKPFDPLVLRARVNSCLRKKRARDFELAYLRGVGRVTAAALAVEAGTFTPDTLDEVGARVDALGNLARLFQRMRDACRNSAAESSLDHSKHASTFARRWRD